MVRCKGDLVTGTRLQPRSVSSYNHGEPFEVEKEQARSRNLRDTRLGNYSVWVRSWIWVSRAWLYWRSIWSSVWSFLTRSSRRAISPRSFCGSVLGTERVGACEGGWAGATGVEAGPPVLRPAPTGRGLKASARARGQTGSWGRCSGVDGKELGARARARGDGGAKRLVNACRVCGTLELSATLWEPGPSPD